MQRSTTVNAQDLCGFLELLLISLLIIHIFIVAVIFILVTTARRSVSLPLLGLAAASSLGGAFLAGSSSTFLGLLLVASLVLSFLQLNKPFDLLTVLEIMALGAVDLAIMLVGAPWLVGGCQGPASGAPGNLLVGFVCLGLLGSAGVLGFLDGKHRLALALPVAAPALLHRGGCVFVYGVG